ncbi:MAG TPA: acyl carrier protein, partial [Steroidobacteraceae bacterium]|nr:acyl carrier protein [Steroidobacteraceae bacterium]
LIAQEALIDRSKLSPQATLEALGLDSVDTVSILFAVEEKYGIRLETDQLSRKQTLGYLMDLVQGKAASAA